MSKIMSGLKFSTLASTKQNVPTRKCGDGGEGFDAAMMSWYRLADKK
jgi:hypothetical protein